MIGMTPAQGYRAHVEQFGVSPFLKMDTACTPLRVHGMVNIICNVMCYTMSVQYDMVLCNVT